MNSPKQTFLLFFVILASLCARAGETLDLAGEWSFRLDGAGIGAAGEWFKAPLAGGRKIKLPGTMDDAGLGPKNTKPATLEGPFRLYDYAGAAWYQREVEIPESWRGKRVVLFLERCRWVTTVWLDDLPVGAQDSLIAPHAHDFGLRAAPGRHRLTICVDNTVKIDLGKFVSALFGGSWGNMNGIVGRIELAATPPVWIEEARVYPDVDTMQARVQVRIGNATGKPGSGPLKVGKQTVEAAWDEKGGTARVDLDMSGVKLWDEFSPNLQEITVKLGEDERRVSFGMRQFIARGSQFELNGRPVFLRGTLECSVWPLTGYPPTDTASWRGIFQIEKSYGLNFIRFHSWCPPEAAFEAADIEGVMIQAEGPMANVDAGRDAARDAFIEAELRRIVYTYGNHPSFCLMTPGNEYAGRSETLTRWVEMLVQRDPRHLYSSPSCGQITTNRQWTELMDGRGIRGPGTLRDLNGVVARDGRPVIGHEIGQWMYFPDFNEIPKWRGVMALRNFELIRDDLAKKHLLELAPDYAQASGRFATLLYKEEIEVLLRTRGYAGFSLLDLHDYPTQGTALVGPLDPFWESKGFVTPERFRRYCSPTVPLLRIPKRVYTSGELLEAAAELAHYGPADLTNARPVWSVRDEQGREVAAGRLAALSAPTGKLTELGVIKTSLDRVRAPAKLTVTVSLAETGFANDWEIWVYPEQVATQPPEGVVISQKWEEARTALAEGKKVVLFPLATNLAHAMAGGFTPVFWSPVWFPDQKPNTMGLLCDPRHPLFAQFPTESHSNWQWLDLMGRARLFILDDTPPGYRPLVGVIDNFARNHKLGTVFECRAGEGRLLVCGFDFSRLEGHAAARQFLSALYAYAGSAAFDPPVRLDPGLLDKLFAPETIIKPVSGHTSRPESAAVSNQTVRSGAPAGATFLLTPPPPREPRIHGPKVYGVRPGSPFLYRIPCTGDRPLRFEAEDLPAGLALDTRSGIITGKLARPGTHPVTLVARNERGTSRQPFRIEAGDTLALTPPMGWNSWYIHYDRVSEATMRRAADQMIASGMADFGYQYVNCDDCWNVMPASRNSDYAGPARDAGGRLRPNKRFPDIQGMVDHIHANGLKAGIYISPGPTTCAGCEGSWRHEAQDADTFAGWGFDFLKYDWCSYGETARGSNREHLMKPYLVMSAELRRQNRDIVFNLCQYGMGDVWEWGAEAGHCWRTTGDLGLEAASALPAFYKIGLSNARHWEFAKPGAWNDPDYILIGWVGDARGMGPGVKTTLTPDEQYSYMSLWSLMAAPLVFSGDMARLDPLTLNVLCNAEVIEVDQDPLGRQARILRQTGDEFILFKELEDGSKAVGLFNLSSRPRMISVAWKELGLAGKQSFRDLWRQTELGPFAGEFNRVVPPHGVAFARARAAD